MTVSTELEAIIAAVPADFADPAADYLAGQMELDDPRASPAYAGLHGLPPLYLQIGEFDTVREGAIRLAANALRSGVRVRMESWPGMIQGWHGLVNAGVPEAYAAWSEIRAYVCAIMRNRGRNFHEDT